MVSKTSVSRNLQLLNRLFLSASTPKEALFYSKLALLELCGWIEESMDDIVLRCSVRCLKEPQNRTLVEGQIVKRTYGFEYKSHFREMLIKVVGLVNIERIESRLDHAIHDRFTSTLGTLKKLRDAEAHTHLKGVTRTIDAPSVTITRFSAIYNGLIEYDRVIRNLGL